MALRNRELRARNDDNDIDIDMVCTTTKNASSDICCFSCVILLLTCLENAFLRLYLLCFLWLF